MNHSMNDLRFMRMAHSLAMKARGFTSPNPLVGAVVVRGGKVVGKGYHRGAGMPHAEIVALEEAGSRARNGILYVTLEPCCHLKKRTPPCVPKVVESGVRRVVIAMEDPNPRVSGKGIRALRKKGIEVEVGVLSEKARSYNESYIKFVTTGRPFVILKVAASLDGKVSTARGESRWITGESSRKFVHQLRQQCDGILVGIGTVLSDDPLLTVRLPKQPIREPFRIVLDTRLRFPLKAKMIRKADPSKTIIVTGRKGSKAKQKALEERGVRVLREKSDQGGIDMLSLIKKLGGMSLTSLLIEGGPKINASALASKIVNKVIFFLAPKIIGGTQAKGAIAGNSPESLKKALSLERMKVTPMGKDWMVEGYLH